MDDFVKQQVFLAQKKTLEEKHGDDWHEVYYGNYDDAYECGGNDADILSARNFLDYLKVAY